MLRPNRVGIPTVGILLLLTGITPTRSVTNQYSEDFNTLQYADTLNTTAWWDTAGGLLTLHPFVITRVGGYDTPGSAGWVCVAGNYAYVVDGAVGKLQVLDVSDPANPTSAGSFTGLTQPYYADVAGDYAYVADPYASSLVVVDISDPTSPSLAGSYYAGQFIRAVTVWGDYAYLAGDTQGLYAIDITDPASPTYRDNLYLVDRAYEVAVAGEHAYVANGPGGLKSVDISDPTNLTLAGAYDTPGSAIGVVVAGNYAFVADGEAGVQVIDVTDPTSLALAGAYDTPGSARKTALAGDHAYVADGDNGIVWLDASDPTSPFLLGRFATDGYAGAMAVDGAYGYIADGDTGVTVVELASEYAPPKQVAAVSTGPSAYGVDIDGDYAFAAGANGGLRVIDISDPTGPAIVATAPAASGNYDVDVAGNHAFIADALGGLRVVDISNPLGPTVVGSYYTGFADGVAVSDDYAYIADRDTGLLVFDVSDPGTPQLVASYTTPGWGFGVAVSGDRAYVADHGGGLRVIDISDPTTPAEVGGVGLGGSARYVALSGNHAYVATGSEGLKVVDITNSAAPAVVGGYASAAYSFGVGVAGDYAYLADGSAGLRVFDVSDPTSPVLLGTQAGIGDAYAVMISGDFAYVGSSGGFRVIRVFQRRVDLANNAGQSWELDHTTESIVRARLTTTQADTVDWELSSNGGTDWTGVVPDDTWQAIDTPAGDLRWRAVLVWDGVSEGPYCSSIDINWLYSNALIDSIVDVPEDQGGWVRVYFSRSGYDFTEESVYPITSYFLFGLIQDPSLASSILDNGIPVKPGASGIPRFGKTISFAGRDYAVETGPDGASAELWEVLGSLHAHQEDHYIFLAPTLADSFATVYRISAETSTPSVYFFSPPDTGMSLDNIAPEAPGGFSVVYQPGAGNELSWDACTADDFDHYRVYRSESEDFTPGPDDLVHVTADTDWYDDVAQGWRYHYRITALDRAGNESTPAAPGSASGGGEPVPAVFAVLPNAPNPFRTVTTIAVDVPLPMNVRVDIFNVRGQYVRTLIDQRVKAGRELLRWDGKDASGRVVPSGVYFCRVAGCGVTLTQKMMKLR